MAMWVGSKTLCRVRIDIVFGGCNVWVSEGLGIVVAALASSLEEDIISLSRGVKMIIIIRRYYVLCTRYVNNPKAECSEMSRIFPSNSVGVIDMHPTNLVGISLMTLSRSTLRPSLNAQLQDSNCRGFKSYLLTNFAGSLSLVLRSNSWPFGAGLYSPRPAVVLPSGFIRSSAWCLISLHSQSSGGESFWRLGVGVRRNQ